MACPFFHSRRTGSNLSSRTQSPSACSRKNLSFRRNSPSRRLASSLAPPVCHPSVQSQPARSDNHAVSDLDVTRVLFDSPCREDRRGAVDLKLCLAVDQKFNPLVGWKPRRVRDLVVQVGKLLTTLWVGHAPQQLIDIVVQQRERGGGVDEASPK